MEVDAIHALFVLLGEPISYSKSLCDDEAYWSHFKCDCSVNNNTTCKVKSIDLSNVQLEGSIPEEIGNLSYLEYLDLSSNMLSGTIPASFVNLSKLKSFVLYDNLLEGRIPPVLFKMKSLTELDLSVNFLNGTISSQFDEIPFLQYLNLGNNLLSGEIPKQLGNISSLQILVLPDNMLGGELPLELGNLGNLTTLVLANNEFNGSLPPSFGKLKNMLSFTVRGNNLIGKFPDIVFSWQKLSFLFLIGNDFEAPLPDKFPTWQKIQSLHITDLTRINQDSKFPDISKLSDLISLTLRNCSLVGPIHPSVWKLQNLRYLDLSFNRLSGGVPSNIGVSLIYLYLRSNEFNKSLPKWLTENRDLHVDISENKFRNMISVPTGKISHNTNLFACCSGSDISDKHEKWMYGTDYCPNDTSRDDKLYINCGGNSITMNGSNYEADLQQEGGSTFFLSNSKRWGYSSMGKYLTTEHYLYILSKTSNLTIADVYHTARIAPISLKYYGFCLKKKQYIVKLHFAEIGWDKNQVIGVKNQRSFNVKIQGKTYLTNFNIEAEAGGIDSDVTKEFIVEVNSTLEIHLYWSGNGSIYWPTKYYGPLISAISVSPVPRKHKKLSIAAIVGIGASSALCIILTLVLFRLLGWFGGKKLQYEAIELYPGGYFNFQHIKAATQNFDVSRKLGQGGFGSVFKGVLPNGTEIAVKQLSTRSRQGIHEFVNEIGTISALQHPNLVRLMGCCAENNQLLLIYEYMENNSLAHALFGHEETKLRLKWTRRAKICLDIAKGLAFLHEESQLKIIHRDIKATNILLDKDLNAKIADFGYAKLFEDGDSHIITRIAGTLGYMAPEYAMRGHLTTKVDVYSFGVVTLEIVSGKSNATYRPNDQTVSLLDLAYVSKEQGNLLALVDPNLGSDYSSREATTLLELAILCTNQSPTLRPTMSEVVNVLEGKSEIKTTLTNIPHLMDNFNLANSGASLSQSSNSENNLEVGPSRSTISHSISNEIEEYNFSVYHSAKIVMQNRDESGNESFPSAANSLKAITI